MPPFGSVEYYYNLLSAEVLKQHLQLLHCPTHMTGHYCYTSCPDVIYRWRDAQLSSTGANRLL
ncbi:hypothetical protein AOLI_G00281650 [Acnodon oligacanthus]